MRWRIMITHILTWLFSDWDKDWNVSICVHRFTSVWAFFILLVWVIVESFLLIHPSCSAVVLLSVVREYRQAVSRPSHPDRWRQGGPPGLGHTWGYTSPTRLPQLLQGMVVGRRASIITVSGHHDPHLCLCTCYRLWSCFLTVAVKISAAVIWPCSGWLLLPVAVQRLWLQAVLGPSGRRWWPQHPGWRHSSKLSQQAVPGCQGQIWHIIMKISLVVNREVQPHIWSWDHRIWNNSV